MGVRADQAAEAIQHLIQQAHLQQGEKIPSQRQLSAQLNISRTALREGISTLIARGELRSEPGRGVFVLRDHDHGDFATLAWSNADISPSDVYQLRYVIEPFVTGLVATRITLAAVERLGENVAALRSALTEQQLERAADLDFQFHDMILGAAGNPTLKEAVMTRMRSYRSSQSLPFVKEQTLMETWREHRRIMLALKRHSTRSAIRAMRDHILRAALRGNNHFDIPTHG